jgi:tRNA A22 N-methylase
MQSIKRLGSIRQFCMALLNTCLDIGADFADLPEYLNQPECDAKME